MSTKPVIWGVLSTAKIGREKVIPAMKQGKLCQIKAIASREKEVAKKTADELGIPKAYGSYEELLDDPEIEAVYNPLPNHLHVPWSILAAEAGKHVLCEKPISLTAAETQTLIEVRDRKGILITEAFMVRSHPQWVRTRELVRQGRIGNLRAIQGFFSYSNTDPNDIRNQANIGGGAIYDIGCYPIVISRFLFEAEPRRVIGLIEYDPKMKIDRLSSALLDFPTGQASFVCSTQMVPYQRMQIFGTKGRIEIQIPFNTPSSRPCKIFIDNGSQLADKSAQTETFNAVDQYTIQGELFSQAVRSGNPVEFPLEDGLKNMQIIDGLFNSVETGRWKILVPDSP